MRIARVSIAVASLLSLAGASAWALLGQPEMSPEEMMKYYEKVGAPGPHHAVLNAVVGEFDAKGAFWMDPSAPPVTSGGHSANVWVLGGRYIQMKYEGDFMEQQFTGIGYLGYDNMTKRYQSTWMDSMSTLIMFMQGDMDEATKTITWKGKMPDPITGQTMLVRETLRIASPDRHVIEWFQAYPDSEETKTMEIVYTRR